MDVWNTPLNYCSLFNDDGTYHADISLCNIYSYERTQRVYMYQYKVYSRNFLVGGGGGSGVHTRDAPAACFAWHYTDGKCARGLNPVAPGIFFKYEIFQGKS